MFNFSLAFLVRQPLDTVANAIIVEVKADFDKKADIPEKSKPRCFDRLSDKQRHIVMIRKSLDMTQDSFANALNIKAPRLLSYEYGRAEPPDHIIQAAEAFARKNARLVAEVAALDGFFSSFAMPDLLERWCLNLGVSYDDDYTLSKIFDVSKMTLGRWKKNTVRPTNRDLQKMESISLDKNRLAKLIEKESGNV